MDNRLVVVGTDDKLNIKISDLLEQLGFLVTVFKDALSLMDFVESNDTQLAFIGEVGDGGPGYSICRQLRERYPSITRVLLVRAEDVETQHFLDHQASPNFAHTHLIRPFTGRHVLEVLTTSLEAGENGDSNPSKDETSNASIHGQTRDTPARNTGDENEIADDNSAVPGEGDVDDILAQYMSEGDPLDGVAATTELHGEGQEHAENNGIEDAADFKDSANIKAAGSLDASQSTDIFNSDEATSEWGPSDASDGVQNEKAIDAEEDDGHPHQLDANSDKTSETSSHNGASREVLPEDANEFADFFDGAAVQEIESDTENAFDALFTPTAESSIGLDEEPPPVSPNEMILTSSDVLSARVDLHEHVGTIALDDSDICDVLDESSQAPEALSAISSNDDYDLNDGSGTDDEDGGASGTPFDEIQTVDALEIIDIVDLDDPDNTGEFRRPPLLVSETTSKTNKDGPAPNHTSNLDYQKTIKLLEEELSRRADKEAKQRELEVKTRGEINGLKNELRDKNDRLRSLERLALEHSSTVEDLREEVGLLRTENVELTALNTQSSQSQVALSEQNDALTQELQHTRQRMEEMKTRLERAQSEAEKSYEEVKSTQELGEALVADLRTSHEDQTESLAKERDSLKAQLASIQSTADEAQDALQTLQSQFDTLQRDSASEITSLQEKIEALKNEATLREESTKKAFEAELESAHSNTEGAIARMAADHSAALEELKRERDHLKSSLEAQNSLHSDTHDEYRERLERLERSHQEALGKLRNEMEKSLADQAAQHAHVLAGLKSNSNAHIDGVEQAHSNALEEIRREHAKAMERQQTDHLAEVLDLRRQHSEELETAASRAKQSETKALERQAAQHGEDMESLHREHESQRAQLTKLHEESVAGLSAEHERQITELRTEYRAQLDAMRQEHLSANEALRDTLKGSIDDLKNEHAQSLVERSKLHESSMASQKALHDERLESIKSLHQQELDGVRSDFAHKLGVLTRENASAYETLEKKHEADLRTLTQTHQDTLDGLRADLSAKLSSAEAERERLTEELKTSSEMATQAANTEWASRLQQEIETKDAEFEAERMKHSEELASHKDSIAALKTELESKAEQAAAESEAIRAELQASLERIERLEDEHNQTKEALKTRTHDLKTVRDDFEKLMLEVEASKANETRQENEIKRLASVAADEARKRHDIAVEFAAKEADLAAKYTADLDRTQTLERAVEGLNTELALRERKTEELKLTTEKAQSESRRLTQEIADLKASYAHREDAFKKLRMAIAVANTFAGEVEPGDDDGQDGLDIDSETVHDELNELTDKDQV